MRGPSPRAALLAGANMMLAFGGAGEAWADPSHVDTILLESGERLRGEVMEESPEEVVILLLDDPTKKVPRSAIREIREAGRAPQAQGQPSPTIIFVGSEADAETAEAAEPDDGAGLRLAGVITMMVGGAALGVGGVCVATAAVDGSEDARMPAA